MEASISPTRLEQLLREVRTIKAYSTRVEEMLTELQGSVGTARKAQLKKQKKKDEMIIKIRQRFNQNIK